MAVPEGVEDNVLSDGGGGGLSDGAIVAVVLAPLLCLCCCCCCVALALRALSRASPGLLRGWVRPARSQRHAPSLATTVFTAGA